MFRAGSLIILLPFIVIFQGCAQQVTITEGVQEQLILRVQERWELISNRDYSGAWVYSTPEFKRFFSRDTHYMRFHGLIEYGLTEVQLLAYDSGAAVASVRVRVMISPGPGAPAASLALGKTSTTIDEKWKMVAGSWYFVDRVR